MVTRCCAVLVAVLWLVCGRAGAFVFVHLSDTHVNVTTAGRFHEEGLANLRRAIAAIQIIRPAFVIVTGDVTELGDDASLAAYRAEIDKAGVPVYSVQGNHDRPQNPEAFNRIVGPTHPTFDYEGCRFIGLNLDRPAEALTFLETQLKTARDAGIAHALTFAHLPLMAPDSPAFNVLPGYASLGGAPATRYLDLAQRFGIVGHFAGHLHPLFDVADPYTGVPSLAVPACVDRNATLRVCSFSGGVLSWSIASAGTWPVAVLESAQPHVQWGKTYVSNTAALRILTFGPQPVQEAEARLGADTVLTVEKAAEPGVFVVPLGDPQRRTGIYPLRVSLFDAAGKRTEWTWPLLIKGAP